MTKEQSIVHDIVMMLRSIRRVNGYSYLTDAGADVTLWGDAIFPEEDQVRLNVQDGEIENPELYEGDDAYSLTIKVAYGVAKGANTYDYSKQVKRDILFAFGINQGFFNGKYEDVQFRLTGSEFEIVKEERIFSDGVIMIEVKFTTSKFLQNEILNYIPEANATAFNYPGAL